MPPIGVQIANQRLQQRRFTHAIGAEYCQLLADFEQQLTFLNSGPLSKTFRRASLPERYGTVLSCSKTDERVLTAGRLSPLPTILSIYLRARRCLTRFRGVALKRLTKIAARQFALFFALSASRHVHARRSPPSYTFIIVTRIDAQKSP